MYIALLNAGSNALRGKYTTLALIIITIAAAIIDNWPIPELANIVKSIFFKKTNHSDNSKIKEKVRVDGSPETGGRIISIP